ncbi:N-acetylmuramoyl-L-alanine amidase [Desulfuribacillus alkaliarsenatis]|uniref:SH3b domain-containing protein n=1 Tax=Desulfuribacillus alkaliarsenatis TaxID=766136 RepID=A0A1E5FYP5_9FIRM|nr:N-acetylmuramoyl-L-alanine amidase [Desulfuribacillus alkaliarsenatis]OEF95567.1 hypothetical protein BHF68_11970 [Desulfuribacillus alkaliarsenatis]
MIRYFLFVVLSVATVFIIGSQVVQQTFPNHYNDSLPSNQLESSNHGALAPLGISTLENLLYEYNNALQYDYNALVKSGIVNASTLNIRLHPNTNWNSAILATVSKGEQLDIIGEHSTWYQVSYNGNIGWVSKRFITPAIELLAIDRSGINLEIINNNSLKLTSNTPFEAVLSDNNNGKYTIYFNNMLLPNSIFDLNHFDIPLFRTFSNQLEVFTRGWTYATLIQDTETSYTLSFTPVVYQAALLELDDRQQLKFITSGRPDYSFTIEENQLILSFTNDVSIEYNALDINNSAKITEIQRRPQDIIIEAKQSVTWKVFSDSSSLTIDISNRGIKGKRIMLDPGHGGSEVGTYGRQSGVLEKDFNLNVAYLLKAALEDAGAVISMTRYDDNTVYQGKYYETYKDLMKRLDITCDFEADLFISIHADNFPADLSINGTAAFYYDGSPHSFQSRELALLLGSHVSEAIGTRWLGVKEQSFVVVQHNPFPSVLMELGFLSNRQDEAKLIDPAYQQKMAEAMTQAIIDYYE